MSGCRWARLSAAGSAVLLAISLPGAGPAGAAVNSASAVHPAVAVPRKGSVRPGMAHYHYRRYPLREKSASPGPQAWPAAASGTADLPAVRAGAAPGQVRVAGTPVFLAPVNGTGPVRVAVTVASHVVARRLGITGVVFRVAAVRGSGRVVAGIDYAGFADAYGGGFGSRLQLVELPVCAMTASRQGQCAGQRLVRGAVNLPGQQELSGAVTLPASGAGIVLAATSTTTQTNNGNGGSDGGGTYGSFSATSLQPSGTWSVGGSTGDFTYSYPIPVPPAPSGLAPSIGLNYDSGRLDGQTSATQEQANWLGDGWSTPDNYIEQTFVPCTDQPEGAAPDNAPSSGPTYDNCYDGQALTLSLNGTSTSIVASGGTFVLANDNGETVQKLTDPNNGTGSYDHSYWVITDRSGTKYYFGLNHLPGWGSSDQATNSVDYEPVFCAHSTDPCYNSSWASSVQPMAYRWHLDYVVDAHNNAMAWYYRQDKNAYVQDAPATYTTEPNATADYIRDSHLDHIDYGFTDGNAYTVNGGHAPDQVVFSTGARCNPTTTCPGINVNEGDYPDVPWDFNCTKGSACSAGSPTFWSTVELTGITTRQWTGGPNYTPVDQWTFTQSMPSTGDGAPPTLFLSAIARQGMDTSAGSTQQPTLPAVTFSSIPEDNRLNIGKFTPAMTRARISSVATESGAVTTVTYQTASACTSTDQATPSANTGSCFPQWWTPNGSLNSQGQPQPVLDWFNKYQVAKVTVVDMATSNHEMYTQYNYPDGGAAWHFDDNEAVKPGYRTYSQYRGFGWVQTLNGQGDGPPAVTKTTYYQGMSDDNNSVTVNLKDSQSGQHEDINQLAGQPLETSACGYDTSCSSVTGSTIYSYWVSPAVVSRDRTSQDLLPVTANATGQVETWTRQALYSGTTFTAWRKTETDTSYYSDLPSSGKPDAVYFGLPRYTYVHGDLSLTGNNQVRCTTSSYAPADTTDNIVGLVTQTETDALPCGGTSPAGASAPTATQINALTMPSSVSRPADVVSATCTVYDDSSLSKNPPPATSSGCPASAVTTGDVSEVFKASDYPGSQFTYQLQKAAVYDSLGRVIKNWDGNINLTTTSYTPNSYELTTGITTTNPLGQSATVTLDPARGITTATSDINDITTVMHYDGLGRIVAEWAHNRYPSDPGTTPPPADATFSYFCPTPPPAPDPGKPPTPATPWAVTTNVLNDNGTSTDYATYSTIYDGLLRVRQTQATTPQAGRLVTDTLYSSRGLVWKTNNRWWDTSAAPGTGLAPDPADSNIPSQTVTAYDGLGRPVLVTSYDNTNQTQTVHSQIATAYDQATNGDGDATISVPLGSSASIDTGHPFNGGAATATVTDALGRTTQLDQYTTLPGVTVNGTSPVTVTITGGVTQATDYTWGNTTRQATVTDDATGQAWTADANLLGQETTRTSPDSGTTTMAYDGNGNLTQTTDANGTTLSWTYDQLNRKTTEHDITSGPADPGNEMASWAYDNSDNVAGVTNPLGHLTTATRYIGGNTTSGSSYTQQATGFDQFGNALGQTITLNATGDGALDTSYHFDYTYKPITGVPQTAKYPASPASPDAGSGALPGETVTYGYDTSNGLTLPASTGGIGNYAFDVTYTALGQVQQEILGSKFAAWATLNNTWDKHTGLLTDTNLVPSGQATPVDDTTYTYDPAGNPAHQTETRTTSAGTSSETQCFAYDTLDRLSQAWTATDNCAADPAANSGATVGDGISGAAYWTSWKYSPLGLRTSETGHGLNGAADTTTTYTYNGNGQNQPDTLTSTASTGGDTGTAAYKYDKDGNLTSRSITDTTSTSQTLSWNDDGTLGQVTGTGGTSSYIYDANGQLLLQKNPGTTTLYLPGEQLTLHTATGDIDGTRYYPLPGGGTAVRTGTTNADDTTSTSYLYELGDQHGTGTLTIGSDLTAKSVIWRQYTPFGGPRGQVVTWPDNHGFLNKPQDTATGLTSIGARWYDPATATFQSLDPVFDPGSPQQHNGYTYAASNPVTNADPSGLRIIGCGPSTCGGGGSGGPAPGNSGSPGSTNGGGPGNNGGGTRTYTVTNPGPCAARGGCRYAGEVITINPGESFGNPWDFIAGLGSPVAGLFDLGMAISTPYQYALDAVQGRLPSQAYNHWLSNHGINTNSDAFHVGGFDGGILLAIATAGGAEAASGAAAEASSTAADAAEEASSAAAGTRAAEAATTGRVAQEASSPVTRVADSCVTGGGESFTPNTRVLTASGAAVPISQLRPGDRALTMNTKTGRTSAETIAEVLVHRDTDRYDLTVNTRDGTAFIQTTRNHPFWDPAVRKWVKAAALKGGARLETRLGGIAIVVGGHDPKATTGSMWDLTIPGNHDFYVQAATTAILVHNDVCRDLPSPFGSDTYAVLGRRAAETGGDINVARPWPGHEVLTLDNWTIVRNDEWVAGIIAKRQPIYLASPIDDASLAPSDPRFSESIFAREINQVLNSGVGYNFSEDGNYLLPP